MKNDATKKEKRPTRKMPDSVKITHEKYRTRKNEKGEFQHRRKKKPPIVITRLTISIKKIEYIRRR